MKKLIIICILFVNIFVLIFLKGDIKYIDNMQTQIEILNENEIRMYNKGSYKLSEVAAIDAFPEIEEITYKNFSNYRFFTIENKNLSVDASGLIVDSNNQFQKELTYLSGTNLKESDEVVISQVLADVLIDEGYVDDYQSLIGKKISDDLEIVGIYENINLASYPDIFSYMEYDPNSKEPAEQITNIYISNSFLTFNNELPDSSMYTIDDYNREVQYEYNRKGQYDVVVDNYNDSDETNDDVFPTVNYEESVANGAEGLIDPNSKEYGDSFNQFVTIYTKDKSNNEQVVTTLQKMFPNAVIITKDTKYSEIIDAQNKWTVLLIIVGILEAFIFIPMIRNERSK